MPAKLTDKPLTKAQFEALGRIEGTHDGVNHVNYFVYKSLADRRYFTSASDGSWALTQRAKDAVYAYMNANPGAVYAEHTLTPQQIALYQGNFNTQGVQGNNGPDDSGIGGIEVPEPMPQFPETPIPTITITIPDPDGHYVTLPPIPAPDHSDDETQPIEPLKTTFNLYDPPSEDIFKDWKAPTARQMYSSAYRAQRLDAKGLHDGAEVLQADLPLDIVTCAIQSHLDAPDPLPEVQMPFIVRAWYKRLLDAQKRLSTIPLDDNAGFNDAVLDFKLTKSRYMSIAQHWNGCYDRNR